MTMMINGFNMILRISACSLFICVLCFVPSEAKKNYPQEERQLWLSAAINFSVSNEFDLEVSKELRYYKERSVLAQSLSNIGGTYKFTDFFKLGLFYRFRYMPDENDRRHEVFTNLSIKHNFGKLDLSDRTRIHVKFRENQESINNLRNMATIGYKFADWFKPYLAAEIFYRFLYNEGDRLTQGRYYLGWKFNFLEIHELDVFFMREEEYNTKKAVNSNVIGFEYELNLKI